MNDQYVMQTCMALCAKRVPPAGAGDAPPCAFIDHPAATSWEQAAMLPENGDCMKCLPGCIQSYNQLRADLASPEGQCTPETHAVAAASTGSFHDPVAPAELCLAGQRPCLSADGRLMCQSTCPSASRSAA